MAANIEFFCIRVRICHVCSLMNAARRTKSLWKAEFSRKMPTLRDFCRTTMWELCGNIPATQFCSPGNSEHLNNFSRTFLTLYSLTAGVSKTAPFPPFHSFGKNFQDLSYLCHIIKMGKMLLDETLRSASTKMKSIHYNSSKIENRPKPTKKRFRYCQR